MGSPAIPVPAAPAPDWRYTRYRQVLADNAALPPHQWSFKSDPAFQQILEHVSPEQGEAYSALLEAEYPRLWNAQRLWLREIAQSNDRYGVPVVCDTPLGNISPTNLRYLYHSLLAMDHAYAAGLRDFHVIEIGGGYGGGALWFRTVSRLWLDARVLSYTIVDVPEASNMQTAFCREVGAEVRTNTHEECHFVIRRTTGAPRFLISNYAFSEFMPEMREWYSDQIVSHCERGFLVWNMIPVYPPARGAGTSLTVEDERPLTGPGNRFVRY